MICEYMIIQYNYAVHNILSLVDGDGELITEYNVLSNYWDGSS